MPEVAGRERAPPFVPWHAYSLQYFRPDWPSHWPTHQSGQSRAWTVSIAGLPEAGDGAGGLALHRGQECGLAHGKCCRLGSVPPDMRELPRHESWNWFHATECQNWVLHVGGKFVVLQPAWAIVPLGLPHHQPAVCQKVACLWVWCVYCGIGQKKQDTQVRGESISCRRGLAVPAKTCWWVGKDSSWWHNDFFHSQELVGLDFFCQLGCNGGKCWWQYRGQYYGLAGVVSPGEPVGSGGLNVNAWVRLLARLVPSPPRSIVARLAMLMQVGAAPA